MWLQLQHTGSIRSEDLESESDYQNKYNSGVENVKGICATMLQCVLIIRKK